MRRVALVHAYSRKSGGDGLLADLSLERLARAGIPREAVDVFALDAPSFADLPSVFAVGTPGRGLDGALVRAAGQLLDSILAGRTGGRFAFGPWLRRLLSVDKVVGVGGGYLRAGTRVNRIGALLNHAPVLLAIRAARLPAFHLPASVGPFTGRWGECLRRLFGAVDVFLARDDETAAELAGVTTVRRVPDLAILDLAERWPVPARGGTGGPVVLAPRDLEGAPGYEERLRALLDRLPGALLAAQTAGPGLKDDARFCRRLGRKSAGRLPRLLRAGIPGVVISVRLHGALMALAAGIPAIHLAYQRKGRAACADLGIEEWLFDARSFDPATVAERAKALARDAGAFWGRIEGRVPGLREQSRALDEELSRWLS